METTNPSCDSLHGLKFGQKIYFEDGATTTTTNNNNKASSHCSPMAKRGKGGVQQQTPRCQVEGCKADLSEVKAYYCRHKVCGMHSKAPIVIVGGLEQRFCQQCSRFHLLPEFDQGKRSCRRRLAGHNERRRKPPQNPFVPPYGRFGSSFHEPGRFRGYIMDFSYPRPSNTFRDVWPSLLTMGDRAISSHWQGGVSGPPTSATVAHGSNLYLDGSLSSSSCALSLLSTQPLINNAVGDRAPTSYASSSNFGHSPMAHIAVSNNLIPNSWGFRGQGNGVSPHEIQHDMSLGVGVGTEAHFPGELELALQGNCLGQHGSDRSFDHFNHEIHWSL